MKTRNVQTSIKFLAIGLFAASALQGRAELTSTIEANQIAFMDGKPMLADGTGTIKNEKDETVASGKLIINGGTVEVAGQKGAVFAYPLSSATIAPTNWPTEAPANVALVDFDGKDKWTLKDDQFLFMFELDGQFHGKVLTDKSLLSWSRIGFPEGTYSIWGYSIVVGTDGGTVVFKQGLPVDGENTTVETPEKKKLEFPRKTP